MTLWGTCRLTITVRPCPESWPSFASARGPGFWQAPPHRGDITPAATYAHHLAVRCRCSLKSQRTFRSWVLEVPSGSRFDCKGKCVFPSGSELSAEGPGFQRLCSVRSGRLWFPNPALTGGVPRFCTYLPSSLPQLSCCISVLCWMGFTLTCVLNFSLIFRLFASTQAFLDNVFTEHTRRWEGEYF